MATTCSNSMHEGTGTASTFGRPSSSLYFTLDVLTDGSEFTGHGTIFLSVWKRPKVHQQRQQQQYDESWASSMILDIMSTSAPIARYAISGLGDATARLCADQRLKLASTRAVFVPSYNQENENPPDARHSDDSIKDRSDCNSGNDRRRSTSSSLCWDGLPALLLALHTAGAASLHLVTPAFQAKFCSNDDTVKCSTTTTNDSNNGATDHDPLEELATLILGRHKDLRICTCHIPIDDMQDTSNASESEPSTTTKRPKTSWWKVYDDEYLLVHATTIPMKATTANTFAQQVPNTVYLYSIAMGASVSNAALNFWYTLAIFPPLCNNIQELYSCLDDFPILADSDDGCSAPVMATIDCIIALNPFPRLLPGTSLKQSNHRELPPILVTLPGSYKYSSDCGATLNVGSAMPPMCSNEPNKREQKQTYNQDPGILIRSQQVTKIFSDALPWAFPFCTVGSGDRGGADGGCSPSISMEESNRRESAASFQSQSWLRLSSCTSVLLHVSESIVSQVRQPKYRQDKVQFVFVDRKAKIWERPKSHSWSNTKQSLHRLVPTPLALVSTSAAIEDENEIDLDDEEAEAEETEEEGRTDDVATNFNATTGAPKPHLLVLGTGCASPSAIRGASGYALIFPSINHTVEDCQQVLLLDCGEGATAMFSRHAGGVGQFSKILSSEIVGIWISHAHLDHYGGLPTLVRAIYQASRMTRQRQTSEQNPPPPSKQARLDASASPPPVPWIMAPTRVLQFLDVMLHCKDGKRLGTSQQWFVPMVHNANVRHRHQHQSLAAFNYGSSIPPAISIPLGPWIWFQNIPVQHSCGPSYGLLLAWKQPQKEAFPFQLNNQRQKTQWFCFSGDTRPCRTLVQTCHEAIAHVYNGAQRQLVSANANHPRHFGSHLHELFLVHEATFQDDQQEQAIKKKHSTVSEALMVARDIALALSSPRAPLLSSKPPSSTMRVLLTHFSNRYYDLELPKVKASNANNCNDARATAPPRINDEHPNVVVGLAMDGLWIEL